MPNRRIGRRPKRSEIDPYTSCAAPKPSKNAVMINWRLFSSATPSALPIAGSAGSIVSIASAA
jgi:hypothetical protein